MAWRFNQARAAIEGFLGYQFTNSDFLREALPVEQVDLEYIPHFQRDNRMLALLGDSLLDTVLTLESYRQQRSSHETDGFRRDLVCNENLSIRGKRHQLDQITDRKASLAVETTVEAIFGAMFLDSGLNLEVVKTAMGRLGLLLRRNEDNAGGIPHQNRPRSRR